MKAFVWDERFLTGLLTVDEQHKHLVDLVNRVGNLLLEGSDDEKVIEQLFNELSGYALHHFADEERLMCEMRVDPRHAEPHIKHHREFVKQLTGMWERRSFSSETIALLRDYLAFWLTMHILGEDQVMARMIFRIQENMSPEDAYLKERERHDKRLSALLDAMHKLYHLLSMQNRDLSEANISLEQKVQERTSDLAAMNERLIIEQEGLKQALAQVQSAQQQLWQSEKMASLGRMVAGLAHEINTPLGVAVGAVSHVDYVTDQIETMFSAEEVNVDDLLARFSELREGSKLAGSNLKRAAELVGRLKRSYVDQVVEGDRPFNLRNLIDDLILGMKAELLEKGVEISIDCPEDFEIVGYPLWLEQALDILVSNALQHAFPAAWPAPEIKLHASKIDELKVRLICQDNGQGMSSQALAHLFEPFYTTQRGQGATGLGLYLCYNIVASRLGGELVCRSELGHGTIFEMLIPISPVLRQVDETDS